MDLDTEDASKPTAQTGRADISSPALAITGLRKYKIALWSAGICGFCPYPATHSLHQAARNPCVPSRRKFQNRRRPLIRRSAIRMTGIFQLPCRNAVTNPLPDRSTSRARRAASALPAPGSREKQADCPKTPGSPPARGRDSGPRPSPYE